MLRIDRDVGPFDVSIGGQTRRVLAWAGRRHAFALVLEPAETGIEVSLAFGPTSPIELTAFAERRSLPAAGAALLAARPANVVAFDRGDRSILVARRVLDGSTD
jgi:hypothetical protein